MTGRTPLVPRPVAALGPFVAVGVLDAAEIQLAATFARRSPGTPTEVLLGLALAARAPRLGHVCIELAGVADTVAVDGLDAATLAALPWPEPAAWAAALARSPLVHVGEPPAPGAAGAVVPPLVWDGERLTLHRYARYEREVAGALLARAGATSEALVPATDLDALLDRFFGPEDGAGPDLQRRAARVALSRRLAVVAGGPGTGKTRTVARLLAAAQAAAVAAGRPLQVALVAPTGKAAARLTEAVHHEIDQLPDLPPDVAARMRAAEALTVHRLLGRADGIRFRHDADDPVAHDLVVIDESSMASLPLMARFLAAVRPDAHVVVVGDPDQLASVEAGAVLGEIVRAAAPAPSPLHPVVVVLDRVHRFGAASPIARLADAVRRGDAEAALALLADPSGPEVQRLDPTDPSALAPLLAELGDNARRLAAAAAAGDAAGALAAALETKVLAATRRGPNGVADWQLRTETLLASTPEGPDTSARWYLGRPVMITRNDYFSGLFNGDAGILVATPDGPQVAFAGPDGWRRFEPARLDELDTWWAMTIHKSQGSEFGHAVVALPDGSSPVLTRELLYTAITRAKQRVTVVASAAAVRTAVSRPVTRTSSLAGLLGAEPASPAPADGSPNERPPAEPEQLSLLLDEP